MQQAVTDTLARLQRFARQPRTVLARCEMCSAAIDGEHAHVVETETGRMVCVCQPCALLFGNQGSAKFRRVPRDVVVLRDFHMTDAQWNNLAIPIGLAFLVDSTRAGRPIAVYPSPAGGTESEPMLDAWEALVDENPVLQEFEPDVEALLVNRIDGARDYLRVPIDECYRLVGLVRSRWRGFTGGVELWQEIGDLLAGLKRRAGDHG